MLHRLRSFRHGRLKWLSPMWIFAGRLYRKAITHFPSMVVSQKIGRYGPFNLSAVFAFSDLESWGQKHNNGFDICISSGGDSDVFFDVGAHVGYVTLPVASVMAPGGRVVSFEPSAANAKLLQFHVSRNGFTNVSVENVLVGEEHNIEASFFESLGHHGQNSQNPVDPEKLKIEHGAFEKTRRRMVSIDGYCADENIQPGVIKIDVEGAEIGVLKGAREVLAKQRPLVFLSVHPKQISAFGQTVEDLTDLVRSAGYDLLTMDGEHTKTLFLEEYIMVPSERVTDIGKILGR